MASEGPLSPTSGADDASTGTIAWTNPGNILAGDSATATATFGTTHYLVATGFGFAVPGAAVIDGIVVEWLRSCTFGSSFDSRVRVVKGGVIGSTDRTAGGFYPTSPAYQSYGASTDLWGDTWTPTDVNASDFGAALASAVAKSDTVAVDHCRMTVYYTVSVDPADGFPWPEPVARVQQSAVRVAAYGHLPGRN